MRPRHALPALFLLAGVTPCAGEKAFSQTASAPPTRSDYVKKLSEHPVDPSTSDETLVINGTHRPAIQDYPHAGPVGQPRRVTPLQNRAPRGTQGDWGVFTRGNGESAGFGPVGRYGIAPWAEDWSFLRDKKRRDDPFDPLKFIPLTQNGRWWLTFSGETRLRNWYEEAPFLGTRGTPGSGRFAVRNLYGADLHLGEHVRFFGQLVNADAAGWGGYGYNSTFRKRLDLQQGFVELKSKLVGAKTGLIVGRQQFLDAPSYILYNRETPNVPLSWNGVRGYAIWPRLRADVYDFVGTNITSNKMFNNRPDWSTRLHGLDVTWAPPSFSVGKERVSSFVDLFLIAFRVGGTAAALPYKKTTLNGTTARQDYGFRWYGGAPSFEFSVGGLYQGGSFELNSTGRNRSVSAYAFNAIAGYRQTTSPLHPFLGLQADLYSGGSSQRNQGTVGTYIAPFNPQTNYLETTTYVAPSNLVSFSPVIRITPRNWLSLQFKSPILWRASTDDAVYGPSGAYASTSFRGGLIGIVPQASLTMQLNRHLTWTQYGARFIGSDGLRAAGGKSGSYYQSSFVFRF